jgi:hypothetical protein
MLKVSPPSSEFSSFFSTVTVCLQGEAQWWQDVLGSGERREERRTDDRAEIGAGTQVDQPIKEFVLPALRLEADESGMPDIDVEADADKEFLEVLLTDEELGPEDDDFPTELGTPACSIQQPTFRCPLRELHVTHLIVREFLGAMRTSTVSPRMAKTDAEALIRRGSMEEDAISIIDADADLRSNDERGAANAGHVDGCGRDGRDVNRRDLFFQIKPIDC